MILLAATTLACAGASGAEVAEPGVSAVTGTVLDADGEPAAGVQVLVGDEVTTTDVDGRFSFASVPDLYDAALAVRGDDRAYVFSGLRARAPSLRVFDQALSLKTHGTALHAVLDAPLGDDERVVFVAQPKDAATRVVQITASGDVVGLRWLGGPRVPVEIRALKYARDPATGAPARWLGVAGVDVTAEHRKDAELHLAFGPVGASALRARVDVPRGGATEWATLSIDLGPRAPVVRLADHEGAGGRLPSSVTFVVPDLPGARYRVEAHSEGRGTASASRGALRGGEATTLVLPRAPSVSVREGGVAWTDGDGARVHWAYFGPSDQVKGTGAKVWLATGGRRAALPDLSRLGIDARSAKASGGVFYVVGARGAATVEEAASRGLLEQADGAGGSSEPAPLSLID